MGRPSAYSEELAEQIVTRLIAGESLASISRSAEMPHEATLHRWRADKDHPFREHYAHARACQGIGFGEKVAQIGISCLLGKVAPDAARVAIDALKWSAGRMAPKEFGDRIDVSGEIDVDVGVLAIPVSSGDMESWEAMDKSASGAEIVADSVVDGPGEQKALPDGNVAEVDRNTGLGVVRV